MPTPPPLNRPPLPPTQPAPPITPGQPGDAPQPLKKTNVWLIIGLALIGLGIAAAVVLFLLDRAQRGEHEYDDGLTSEKALRDNSDLEVVEIPAEETPVRVVQSRHVSGRGTAGDGPMTLDITVGSDGNVTGTYWNVLYCLCFSVTGTQDPDGNLDLMLHLDNQNVALKLHSSDSCHYTGTLGESQKYTEITLNPGGLNTEIMPDFDIVYTGHLSGNDMNRTFRIGENTYGESAFWFPDQGYANHLRVQPDDDWNFYLIGYDGRRVATIELHDDYDGNGFTGGDMSDITGRTFTITNITTTR